MSSKIMNCINCPISLKKTPKADSNQLMPKQINITGTKITGNQRAPGCNPGPRIPTPKSTRHELIKR